MALLGTRDPKMYGDHHLCNKCQKSAKYIHKDTHWCQPCLDREQYPQFAHMTDEEIATLRAENIANLYKKKEEYSSGVGFLNANNLKK